VPRISPALRTASERQPDTEMYHDPAAIEHGTAPSPCTIANANCTITERFDEPETHPALKQNRVI